MDLSAGLDNFLCQFTATVQFLSKGSVPVEDNEVETNVVILLLEIPDCLALHSQVIKECDILFGPHYVQIEFDVSGERVVKSRPRNI